MAPGGMHPSGRAAGTTTGDRRRKLRRGGEPIRRQLLEGGKYRGLDVPAAPFAGGL